MSTERSGFLTGSVLPDGAFKPARISWANGIVTDITPCG